VYVEAGICGLSHVLCRLDMAQYKQGHLDMAQCNQECLEMAI